METALHNGNLLGTARPSGDNAWTGTGQERRQAGGARARALIEDEAMQSRFLQASGPILWLSAVALSGETSGQCHYTYTQIPNPPGWTCVGQAINRHGCVTGYTVGVPDHHRAFVWTPETGTTLLPVPPGVSDQQAYDVNDLGHVAGSLVVAGSGVGNVPFLWTGHDFTLIQMPPGSSQGFAYALNNSDQVVGQFQSPNGVRAFLWGNGSFVDLGPTIGGYTSVGMAINDRSQIGGYAYDVSTPHAFRLDAGQLEWLPEPPGIVRTSLGDLNNIGFGVGHGAYVQLGEPGFRALGVVWTPAGTHIVEAPLEGQYAVFGAINDAGQAVGEFSRPSTGPIMWQNGAVIELSTFVIPAAPAGLRNATDVNNVGQIVARASGRTLV
jgi:probable HAF family extracellular repeat protein